MSALSAFVGLPSSDLFQWPPTAAPVAIPPPPASASSSHFVFDIPASIYNAALDPRVPLTIACLYAVTVKSLNVYNKANGKKPWAISQTRGFFAFVVLHNVFLAVYSAWTFWGMLRGMIRSVVSPAGPHGLAGTLDSVCSLHGGAGLGNAAIYDEMSGRWTTWAGAGDIGADGVPSRAAMGRIWNEGLAFYGWIFYLSKFYEVLDTFIILAKGKLSSTLQTYHHAGAMLCMWAGMRYMSAPIWMFVLVNSGIHAMMYTYYTITAFNIRVPTAIKRSLTSMQITQFLVGATYAMAHSFLSYTVPVTVAAEEPSLGSAVNAATTETLKRLVMDAVAKASAEANATAQSVGSAPSSLPATTHAVSVTQPCINTAGETFAIWLNVLYLAPLTYLFVRFFIASYLRRSSAESTKTRPKGGRRQSNVTLAEKAGWEAAQATQREVYADPNEEASEGSQSNSS